MRHVWTQHCSTASQLGEEEATYVMHAAFTVLGQRALRVQMLSHTVECGWNVAGIFPINFNAYLGVTSLIYRFRELQMSTLSPKYVSLCPGGNHCLTYSRRVLFIFNYYPS